MGKRGPLPANHYAPKPSVIEDRQPPATLDEPARLEWARLIDELSALGRVCNLDRSLLAVHCQAVSDYERYSKAITTHGEVYTTESGQIKFRPEVQGRQTAAQLLLKTAQELGFTPNSRSRMNVPTEAKTNTPTLDDILDIAPAKKGNK